MILSSAFGGMTTSASGIFIELGASLLGLALLARLSSRWGLSAIPLYLVCGLAFGSGGLLPLPLSHEFVRIGADIGVALLLFMLGLEYSADELITSLKRNGLAGLFDLLLNFLPGLAGGFLLGWGPIAALLLGGVTYISSSGIAARSISDLGGPRVTESSIVLSILVIEDLAMAIFLPLAAVMVLGRGVGAALISISAALLAVALALLLAARQGGRLSAFFSHRSDEVVVLGVFGAVLLVAGLAQRFEVSAAIGAFLVGIALSGPAAGDAKRVIGPLRDLFAAVYFFFFGLGIDPASLPPVLIAAAVLGAVTGLTKIWTGWLATGRAGISVSRRVRAGMALVARGEFSIIIAGLGTDLGLPTELRPLAAAYVLFLAALGPVLVRLTREPGAAVAAPGAR